MDCELQFSSVFEKHSRQSKHILEYPEVYSAIDFDLGMSIFGSVIDSSVVSTRGESLEWKALDFVCIPSAVYKHSGPERFEM